MTPSPPMQHVLGRGCGSCSCVPCQWYSDNYEKVAAIGGRLQDWVVLEAICQCGGFPVRSLSFADNRWDLIDSFVDVMKRARGARVNVMLNLNRAHAQELERELSPAAAAVAAAERPETTLDDFVEHVLRKLGDIQDQIIAISLHDIDGVHLERVATLVAKCGAAVKRLELHQTDLTTTANLNALTHCVPRLVNLDQFCFCSKSSTQTENSATTSRTSPPYNGPVALVIDAILKIPTLGSIQFGSLDDPTAKTKIPCSPSVLAYSMQHLSISQMFFWNCDMTEDQVLGIAQGFREEFGIDLYVTPEGYADMSDNALFSMSCGDKGMHTLSFKGTVLSDTALAALAHSLCAHPTLRTLNLEETIPGRSNLTSIAEYDRFNARKRTRTQCILEMLHWNSAMEDVCFTLSERDEAVFNKIEFFLHTNSLGLRRLKMEVARSVWGAALIAMKKEASCLFMMLRVRPDLIMDIIPAATKPKADSTSCSSSGCIDQKPATRKGLVSPLSSISRWKSMLGKKFPQSRKILTTPVKMITKMKLKKGPSDSRANSNCSPGKSPRSMIEC